MTANGLRLRRQWDLAEATCSDVLRRDPRSADAHSLMGDICRDRRQWQDAIEWYKMALDLKPSSAADRRKLEELIDQEFPIRRQGLVRKTGTAFSRGLGSAAADVGLGSRASALVPMVGLALAAILVIAVTTVIFGRQTTPMLAPAYPGHSGQFGEEPAPPIAGPSPRTGGGSAETQVAEDLAGDVVGVEEALLTQLQERAAAVDAMAEVVSVQVDPREASALVRVAVPRPWIVTGLRSSIQRVAEELALTAAEDARLGTIRLRCDMRQEGRPDEMALWAEASAARLAGWREAPKPGEALFPVVWWHPELRPSAEGGQAASGR